MVSGCKKEVLVTILPLTAKASNGPIAAICPGGTNTATLGPVAANPNWAYSWTGPSGFTSSVWNPTVSTSGNYYLQVKEIGDASFCVAGQTTVNVTPPTPMDAALTNLTNKAFCQKDNPLRIGLSGAAPNGYVFQWSPGINLDNQQAFNPIYDPGIVPGGPAIGTTNYTFAALRLSDGCIFESTMSVSDTALALAQAGIDLPTCGINPFQVFGAPETTGNYFQWKAVATTYPGGVGALTSHAKFKMDGSSSNLGTNKFLTSYFPNHTACYTIDYEIISSYVPLITPCSSRDTVRLFYCPTCGGDWCSDLKSNAQGTTGVCAGEKNWIGGESLSNLTYTWTTYSVNGVVQAPNSPPKGLYTRNPDGSKGIAFSATGPHPPKGIADDIESSTWGWGPGTNYVIYRLTSNGNFGEGVIDCHRDIQVFSDINSKPIIGIKDNSFCTFPSPGIRLGTNGRVAPYTISGADYTQAPNSAFEWAWSGGVTSGGATPFPVINPTVTTSYIVKIKDPVTGCTAIDTLIATIIPVIADAGPDLSGICDGSLVQIGTESKPYLTYEWSPAAGLNFPIGTANNKAAQPYLLVPGAGPHTYTLQVTDAASGCQATDAMVINTSTTAAVAPVAQGPYAVCPNSVINPYILPVVGYTYQWSAGAGANLAWLSSTTIPNTKVTLPANFTGTATFRLTATKGNCGSAFTDYVFNYTPSTFTLGPDITASCTAPLVQIGEVSAGWQYYYTWSPTTGLYGNNTGTNYYIGSQAYVKVTVPTTYTLTRTNNQTGCTVSDDILVSPPATVTANAGADKYLCTGVTSSIGASGTGTATWTAVGYSSNPNGAVATPTAGQVTTMLGYLSSTSTITTNFSQTTVAVGKYVYRLTTTLSGCTAFDEVTVVVSGFPSDFGGPSQAVCANDEVLIGLNVSGAYTALWTALSPGSAYNTIVSPLTKQTLVRPTVTTVYNVRYTDPNSGCFADDQVTVTVTPSPVVGNVAIPLCAPVAAQDLTSFIPSYNTYLNPKWYVSSLQGTLVGTPTSVTPTKKTSYFLVTENQYACRDTAEVAMNVETPLTPNILPVLNLTCSTLSIDLANYQGIPSKVGNTLEWHNANNTNAASLLPSTVVSTSNTYYLFEKAPSPANCYSTSDNIVVNFVSPPTATLTQTAPTCAASGSQNNGVITLTATTGGTKFGISTVNAASYDGPDFAGATTIVLPHIVKNMIPNTGGTYRLRLYSSQGCYVDKTVTFAAVMCCPTAITITTQPTAFTECLGGTQILSVNATGGDSPLTYQWYKSTDNGSTWGIIAGATVATYTPLSTTASTALYRVTISSTGGTGCSPVTSSNTAVVVVNDPTVSVSISSGIVCVGANVTLTATPTVGVGTCNIQWQSSSDGIVWAIISGAAGNTYNVASLSATTRYRAQLVSCSGSGCCN
jgi:hypothetical protein